MRRPGSRLARRLFPARRAASRARARDDLRGLPRPLRPAAALRAAGRRHGAPPRRLPLRPRSRPDRRRARRRGGRGPFGADLALQPAAGRGERRRRAALGRDGGSPRPRRARRGADGASAPLRSGSPRRRRPRGCGRRGGGVGARGARRLPEELDSRRARRALPHALRRRDGCRGREEGHLGDARDGWRLHLRHRRRRALALGCEAAPPPRRLGRRRLGDVLDDLDELVRAVALRAREADELAGAGDHRSLLGRARHVNAAAAPELEQSLVAEDAERAEDGVRVDAENRREIACGRETVAGIRLSVGDRPPDLRCDLMEESGRFRRIDLDTQHRANHTSTMSGHAPALPLGVDPLIAEAKERARRRRLLALAAAGILVVAGVAIALAGFGGSGSPGTVPWLPTRPNIGPANPPLAPACTASQLKASLFMQGASMSLVGGITIANRGAGPCALVGRPRLSFAGATSKWRETTYHAQNVLPLQYDPLAPPAGSLRALAPGEH